MNRIRVLLLFFGLALTGCNDSNNNSSTTAMPSPEPEPPANTVLIDVELSADQVIAGGATGADGTAELVLNLDDDTLGGTVTLNGITANSVTLNAGFAGESGTLHTSLQQDSTSQWSLPDGTAFDEEDQQTLESGAFYLFVTSAENPDGALRGQILLGAVNLLLTRLSGLQAVPPVETMATGTGFLTVDTGTGDIVVHVHTMGVDDAQMGHIHQALAGVNGGILVNLTQDATDPAVWSNEEGASLDSAGLDALLSGSLYYNIHTPTNPAGEIRGQIEPEGIEIDFTSLTGGDVVIAGMQGVETDAVAIAATTLDTQTSILQIHLNTQNLSDANSASLNIAPEGQNGPQLTALTSDPDNDDHWLLEDFQLSGDNITDLRNQRLYFTVANPTWPDGIIRGQWRPENSIPSNVETFRVTAVSPANGAELNMFPGQVTVTFNRDVSGDTASQDSVILTASGGDGGFGEGNEQVLDPLVINTEGNSLVIDTVALSTSDDVFQLTLKGGGSAVLTDAFGNGLDGDSNGAPGGDFISTFSVVTQMETNATFTVIQNTIFTPNCTFSGCHSGGAPAAGQNLTEGQAYSNIVNVPSTEVPSLLRINPGNPDDSYLIQKVEGTAAVGSRMPLGMPPLSSENIQLMRQWVSEGAQDN